MGMTDDEVHALLEAHGVKLTEIVAWTRGYNPFIMGGSCHYLLASRLPCDKPMHLGKGFYAVLVRGPDGLTKVAEATTGAVVGDTLEGVRADVAACDSVDVMRRQVDSAREEFRKGAVRHVSPDEWWAKVRKAR